MNPKCSKCGSEKIVPLLRVLSYPAYGITGSSNLTAVVDTNPDALFFKNPKYFKLKANICGECGYTELIAEDPAAMYEAYLKTKE